MRQPNQLAVFLADLPDARITAWTRPFTPHIAQSDPPYPQWLQRLSVYNGWLFVKVCLSHYGRIPTDNLSHRDGDKQTCRPQALPPTTQPQSSNQKAPAQIPAAIRGIANLHVLQHEDAENYHKSIGRNPGAGRELESREARCVLHLRNPPRRKSR